MSKKSKATSKLHRLSKKRAQKASNKAKFAELRRLGQNSKSSRFMKNAKKSKKHTKSHPYGACGNIGCKRCNPSKSVKSSHEFKGTHYFGSHYVVNWITPKEKFLTRVGYKPTIVETTEMSVGFKILWLR